MGFSIVNHPFGDTPILGNLHIFSYILAFWSTKHEAFRVTQRGQEKLLGLTKDSDPVKRWFIHVYPTIYRASTILLVGQDFAGPSTVCQVQGIRDPELKVDLFSARRLCRSTKYMLCTSASLRIIRIDRWFHHWLSKTLEWSTLVFHRSIIFLASHFRHDSLAMLQNHLENGWWESLPRNHHILNVRSSGLPISLSWHCLGDSRCPWDTPKLLGKQLDSMAS